MRLNKASIRKALLSQRSQIVPVDRLRYSLQAKKLFIESDLFATHNHFACYLANDNEFDCTSIIEALWKAQKKCYLPVLLSKREEGLQFSLYTPETKLALNRYKILEPAHPEIFSAEKLDVVFLPLVGFDLQANRLGMGAGYYDRTFAFKQENKIKKPLLIGLGYEFQQVENISQEPWDVRLDGILTEKKYFQFSHSL